MIILNELKKSYGDKKLFANLTLRFPINKRIALIGGNGAGKTTLLNIICGLEEADGGEVIIPGGVELGFLPQEPNVNPEPTVLLEAVKGVVKVSELENKKTVILKKLEGSSSEELCLELNRIEDELKAIGAYSLEARAKRMLKGLGFREEEFKKNPKELSGGWRMRLELIKVLLKEPNFLILDEPTNHLDLPSLAWFENYMQTFVGTLLFVSHDKSLLNRLAQQTCFLIGGNLEIYEGNFDYFLDEREKRAEFAANTLEGIRKKKEELQRFVDRFGAKATKAKQAQSRVKMIARLQELESSVDNFDSSTGSFCFSFKPKQPSGKNVFEIFNGSIGYSKPLSKKINLNVWKGNKIAIVGLNGVGKSTLLKTIASKIPALDGDFTLGFNSTIGWFAQDQLDVFDGKLTVLENLQKRVEHLTVKECRSILGGFLFSGDSVNKKVEVLSGGEKTRLGLASVMADGANFLLLDEPTNHLDMSGIEVLKEAVDEFEGTVMIVSHDRDFINSVCTHVFVMLPTGDHALFNGTLEDYVRQIAGTSFPNVLSVEDIFEQDECLEGKIDKDVARDLAADLKRERSRLEKDIKIVEKELSNIEGFAIVLENKLEQHALNGEYQKSAECNAELQDVLEKKNIIEERWLMLSDSLEEVLNKLKDMNRL